MIKRPEVKKLENNKFSRLSHCNTKARLKERLLKSESGSSNGENMRLSFIISLRASVVGQTMVAERPLRETCFLTFPLPLETPVQSGKVANKRNIYSSLAGSCTNHLK